MLHEKVRKIQYKFAGTKINLRDGTTCPHSQVNSTYNISCRKRQRVFSALSFYKYY